MKVLFASSEMFPFVKTGGLGDVANALPLTLKKHSDLSVVVPLYGFLELNNLEKTTEFELILGGINYFIEIYKLVYEDINIYFIKAPILSETQHLYSYKGGDYENNDLRFGIFSAAIVELCVILKVKIVHLNDWHTALSAFYIKQRNLNIKSLFTIHNLAYQGVFNQDSCKRLGIADEYFTMDALEFYGQLNILKAGIAYADAITTVSSTYAQEILTPEFGCGLDGFLNHHSKKLTGILNGINTDLFNPKTDPNLSEHYSITMLENKYKNKTVFLKNTTLKDPRRPLFVVLSRLVEQKGIDLIVKVLPELLKKKINVFILGEGEEQYTNKLESLAQTHKNLEFRNCFDEELSPLVYAAADFLLMPSRFEPCGLAQLIAMRYGTIPIVYATGGLKDSVHEKKNLCGRGIVFEKYTKKEFTQAIDRALKLKKDTKDFNEARIFNMKCDLSFEKGASEYIKLYESLV